MLAALSAGGPSSTTGRLRADSSDFARVRPFSKDLKHRGFSFVGPTVVYAYMQAVGMVKITSSTVSVIGRSLALGKVLTRPAAKDLATG